MISPMRFMKEVTAFAQSFLERPRSVATLFPTMPWTARKIANLMEQPWPQNIVEWGAGTGSVTEKLLEKLPADGKLVAIELDPKLFNVLRSRLDDARLILVQGDARETAQILQEQNIPAPDYIVSGISFHGMSKKTRKEMADNAYETLPPGGVFLPYQFRSTIRNVLTRFDHVEMETAYGNLFPPYDLYKAHKNGVGRDKIDTWRDYSPAAFMTEMRLPSHGSSSGNGSSINGKAANGSEGSSRLRRTWDRMTKPLTRLVGGRNGRR